MTTNRALSDILAPEFISREAARVDASTTLLSDLFGWGLNARSPDSVAGANTNFSPIREGFYDIFNNTRRIAHGSVPGTPSTTTEPQKVGKVQYTIPRSAETIPLLDEKLFNQRAIGGPSSMVDRGGERYILRQIGYQAQRYANLIEFQTAAMLRGSYTYTQDGDLLRQTFSGGETTIDFQIPAGNKSQLNMLGGGNLISASWAAAGTDVPLDIFNVNAAMIALTGRGIKTIVISSTVWNELMNNTAIINQGGSAAPRFNQFDHTSEDPGKFVGILKSMPWIEFLIDDYVLEVGASNTITRLIPITAAVFIPEIKPDWVEYLNGGEGVTEGPNGTHEFREGMYQYSYPTHEPSGWALSAVHNGFPSLMVPECIAFATVTGI